MFFNRIHLIVLLLSPVICTYSQVGIGGNVEDELGNPITFANILLLHKIDSVLVKGTLSKDNGTFLIDGVKKGEYIISAHIMGYKQITTKPFAFDGSSKLILPTLILVEGVELDEVTVTSKKNLYEQKIDRMVINVASSVLSVGSSALEILERSPGVLVDRQNNSISLLGKSGVVVMINGKQSYMPVSSLVQLLQSMNSDNIETIELITTPPANFDAEGNAGFINIVLKEQTDVGLNGSYSLSFGVGNGGFTSNNINFNYRKNNINFFGTYSFLRDTQDQLFQLNRNFRNADEIPVQITTTTNRSPVLRSHNIRAGLDYQASEETVLGLLLWANENKWVMDAVNQSNEFQNGVPSSFVELLTRERNQLQHFGSNFNFKHDFKEDQYISFDLDYLKYNLENPTTYRNNFFDGDSIFLREELTESAKTTPINITASKLDYNNHITDKVKLGLGVKGVYSNFDNDVIVGTFQGEDLIEDPSLTDISNLKERILAGYASMDYAISNKTKLQFGLRYEHTDSELISEKEGVVVDRVFGELFPTAYISHTINDTLALNFSYSRRITRPTFNDMAPFVIFIDPTTFFAGNPAVQPAISNAIKLDVNYKSIVLSGQFSVEDETISTFQSRFDEDTQRLIFGASNLDYTKTFSLTLGLPITITNWWKMQNNITFLNTKVANTVNSSVFELTQNTLNINHTQSFTMAENLTSEINLNYNSPSILSTVGTSVLEEYYGINIGIQKKFGNKGGTLGFKINDVLNSMKWTVTTDIPEQNLNTINTFDFFNRTFLLSYSNSFGNTKLRAIRQRSTGAEEEKSRVQ